MVRTVLPTLVVGAGGGSAVGGAARRQSGSGTLPGTLSGLVRWAKLGPVTVGRRARVTAKQALRQRVPAPARYPFRVDLLAALLAGLYTGAVFPFLGVIARDDLRASPNVLAFLSAAPFLGNLLALLWARATEGRKKVPFVMWSHFGARAVVFMSCLAVGAWPFALVLGGAQIVGTIATPAYAAVMKQVYPDDQRGQLLSYIRAAVLLAQVGSTLVAAWLLSFLSYQVVFPVAAVLGMAAAFVFGRIHPDEQPDPAEAVHADAGMRQRLVETARYIGSTFAILKEDRPFRFFAFSVFTYGFGNLLTVPIVPLIQVDELHISKGELALMFNLMQGAAIVAYFFWGRFVDRKSPQLGVVVNVLLNVLVPLNYVLTAWWSGSAWILLPSYLISGIVMAGIDLSYFNAVLTFSGPDNVPRYQALQSFLLGVRGTLAPFLGGAMVGVLQQHNLNLRWAFVVGGLLMLVGAWSQWLAMRRAPRRESAR